MKFTLYLAILTFAGASAANASTLHAFAGAVGGSGNGNIGGGCTTYGGPFPSFFLSAFSTPVGGIAPCGYFGSTTDLTSPTALSASQSVAGAPIAGGGTYDGSANSHADYGLLGADATGVFTGTLSGTVLDGSMGASFFTDTLTLTSPNVVNGGNGFVRYIFTVHGTLTTGLGPNQEDSVLSLAYNGGAGDQLFRGLSFSNGGAATSTINNDGTPPAGFVFTSTGLSGSAAFESGFYPLIFGAPESIEVGLLAEVLGTGNAAFSSTARLTGILVFDSDGNPIDNFTISSESGTSYSAAGVNSTVPEPNSIALTLFGALALVTRIAAGRRKSCSQGSCQ